MRKLESKSWLHRSDSQYMWRNHPHRKRKKIIIIFWRVGPLWYSLPPLGELGTHLYSVPTGGVVRGCVQLQKKILKTLPMHLPISWWVIYVCTCQHHTDHSAVFDKKNDPTPVPHPPYSLSLALGNFSVCFSEEKSPPREAFCQCGRRETKNNRSSKRHQIDEFKTVLSSGKKFR